MPPPNSHPPKSIFRSVCRKLVKFSAHRFVKKWLQPILYVIPSSIVTVLAKNPQVVNQIQIDSPRIASLINNHAIIMDWLLLIALYILVVTVKAVYDAIEEYGQDEQAIKRDDIDSILNVINQTVDGKAEYLDEYKRTFQSEIKTHTIDKVVNHHQQIQSLVQAISAVFNDISLTKPKAPFRVGLMSVRGGIPLQWEAHTPYVNGQRVPEDSLKKPNSAIMNAIRKKRPFLIEDIDKERSKPDKERQYVEGEGKNEGSLLCYPFIPPMTDQVAFVVTIMGDKKCCLEERHQPVYEWIIRHFVLRIHLEQSLQTVMKTKEKPHE